MADSRKVNPVRAGHHHRATVGVPLMVLGLFLTLGFPQDKLPWPAAQQVPSCGAGADTAVCVSPPTQEVTTTDPSFSVDIAVDNVDNLGAYEFALAFDPSIVSFVSSVNGTFLESTGRSGPCLPPSFTDGRVRFGCVTLGSEPDGPSGSGVLATLTFKPLAQGISALDLTDVILTDIEGTPLAQATLDGEVTVVEGFTPTPCPGGVCPTSTPTSTPTITPTPAVGPTSVLVDPPTQGQLVGATFTVNVAAQNVTDLAAYEFILAWDPTVLDFVNVTDGSFLGSTGRTVSCPSATVGANTVRFGCVTLGSSPGVDGSGVLSVLTFSAFGAGSSALDLLNVGLSHPLGSPLLAAVEDGAVTVTLAPTATPTPCDGECPTATITPTATVTPTPTPTSIPSPCVPGSGVDMCVQPSDQNVSEGSDFSVDISVDDVNNLGAFAFTLAFDPAIVAFVSIEEGPFLGSTGRTTSCIGPTLTVDTVHYTCLSLGAAPPGPSGSGVLASVTFFGLSAGTSSLTLQDAKLVEADISGTPIAATSHDGSVTVFSGPSPTPGPTKTVTPTPTETTTPGPTAVTRVDPPSQTVPVGSNFGVDISIQDVSNLGSYEWMLSYDEDLLNLVGVVDGPFLGSTGRAVSCQPAILDVGSVRFGCNTTGAAPPGPDGAGVLSTVTFSAQAQGTSPLDLVWVQLSDPLADDIATSLQDGEVTVVTSLPDSVDSGASVPPSGSQTSSPHARGAFSLLRPVGWMFIVMGAFLVGPGAVTVLLRSSRPVFPRRHRVERGQDGAGETDADE